VVHAVAARFDGCGECARVRRIRNEAQGAAQRAGAVQSALRPAQHLDLLQVIELEVAIHR
jgi:hypothetical protein